MRILHLSDMHITGDAALHNGIVDTTAALRRVLRAASAIQDIEMVVCSGDLTDDGTPEAYRTLQELVGGWAADRGAPVTYVMGNHDGRDGFEAVLGARTGVVENGGLRILRLDSSIPGFGDGEIESEQLRWLQRELAASELPTIVLLHHPPTPALSPLLKALELANPQELLAICAAGNVRAILAGHYHHSLVTSEHGIPVIVAPGIANTTDCRGPDDHERAVIGSGYAVIDLPIADIASAPRVTFHTAPSPEDAAVIFDLGPAEVASIAASASSRATS